MNKCIGKEGVFEVSTNEQYWFYDEYGLIRSVLCFINGKETLLNATYDENGVCVEYNGKKIYFLVNNE